MLCHRRRPGNYNNLQLAGGRRRRWVGAGAPDDDAHVKQKPSAHWSRRCGRGGTRRLSRSPRAGRVRVRWRRRRVPMRVAAENEFVSIRYPVWWVDGWEVTSRRSSDVVVLHFRSSRRSAPALRAHGSLPAAGTIHVKVLTYI